LLTKSVCKHCLETIPCVSTGTIRGWDDWDEAYWIGTNPASERENSLRPSVACPIYKYNWWKRTDEPPSIECPFFLEHMVNAE